MSQAETTSVTQGPVISRDPEIMSGMPVFAGTRVPVQALLDHLLGGYSIDEFMEGFPSVRRDQTVELLRKIGEMIERSELRV